MDEKYNKDQVSIEPEFNKLIISDIGYNTSNISYKNCSYCNEPFTEELWCKKCDPLKIIEGWTSENPDIDKFIKDTMHLRTSGKWLEWVTFDRFTDIKQIGEGGFSKVYSATWVDGKANYKFDYGNWKKLDPKPMKVALRRLSGSQNISIEYLNELKLHWNVYLETNFSLDFYGITKDPATKEFMIIIEFVSRGSLKNIKNILWENKIRILGHLTLVLKNMHELGYFHKNLHSGNILVYRDKHFDYFSVKISDFGLSGPANKQKSDGKIYGMLPYIAPEVLIGEPYISSSDVYSFGVIMAELSSGSPPFYDRKHDLNLAIDICNGLRPEFGKGTPEIYEKLAHRCMNANPDQRPKIEELQKKLMLWCHSIYDEIGKIFRYRRKKVKATLFEEADVAISNIATSYKKDSDVIYISQEFKFRNLPKPINSSTITLYFEDMNNEGIIYFFI